MNNSGVAEPCDSLSNPDLMQPLSFLYEIILVVWQAMRYLEFYMIHAKVCGENFKIIRIKCAKILFSQVKRNGSEMKTTRSAECGVRW